MSEPTASTGADKWKRHTTLASALASTGLATKEIDEISGHVADDTIGLAIYGSRARGDAVPTSDFDLLQLATHPHGTLKVGRASVSAYTPEQLRSASRTLFGTHLIRDARVLYDPAGVLASVLRSLEPADPCELLARVRRYSVILDVSSGELVSKLEGLVRLARYLVRTAIYAQAMLEGEPCFSVRELASRFNEPGLATLLASDPIITGPPTLRVFEELLSRLERVLGELPRNESDTLLATALAHWEDDRLLATMAIRASGETSEDFDYSDLPKIML